MPTDDSDDNLVLFPAAPGEVIQYADTDAFGAIEFHSLFAIGDPCAVVLSDALVPGHIRAVTFTSTKVRYAVRVEADETTLHNIDSAFVHPRAGKRVVFGPDNYS